MSIEKSTPFCVYTESGYPKLFKKIGLEGFTVIKEHDLDAAKLVRKLKECDQIIHVSFSELKSEYPKKITSFVRCKNGNTFYVTNGMLI